MKPTDIAVARTIPASAERIFDVWMDPKIPGGPWFGAQRVVLNPVVDGLFYIAVKHEGRTWPHFGAESVVTVTMEPRGDQQVPIGFQHRGIMVPTDGSNARYKTWAV